MYMYMVQLAIIMMGQVHIAVLTMMIHTYWCYEKLNCYSKVVCDMF